MKCAAAPRPLTQHTSGRTRACQGAKKENTTNRVREVRSAHHPGIVYCPLPTLLASIFLNVSKIWL